jgi:hypothetical protein
VAAWIGSLRALRRNAQEALDDGRHNFARRRELGQTLADANEDLDAKLVFKLADLPAVAGL